MVYQLRCSDGRVFTIGPYGLTIGRSRNSTVVITDPSVSRLHASVLIAGERYWLRNEKSTSGTFVNGYPVRGQQELFPGDVIQIGSVTFQLIIAGGKTMRGGKRVDQKRRSQLIFVGMAAAAVIILILALGSSGGGGGGPSPIPPSAVISWMPETITITLYPGTWQNSYVAFRSSRNLSGIAIVVSPEISNFFTVYTDGLSKIQANQDIYLPASAQIPKSTNLGTYQGTVRVAESNQPLAKTLNIVINVTALPGADIPGEVAIPSDDRITTDANGQRLVKDEVVVGLKLETSTPETRIRQIASSSGAIILGSVPETLSYQFVYNVSDLGALESLRQDLETQPDVAFASHSYLIDAYTATTSNDTEYEKDWSETTPSGNNWHLESIKAPSAWDITTGSSAIVIGVIDSDFDINHSDLNDNIGYSDKTAPLIIFREHGTHVAGLICAEGNNGQGVSGVMWDCTLRLYTGKRDKEFLIIEIQDRMIKAVEEGARIVNMSLGFKFNFYSIKPEDLLKAVQEANSIYGQAILFAERNNKNVLWVFSAGNESCDAKFQSPASLTQSFPLNTIAVASIDVTGRLSSFSNFGDLVSIAAPGGNVFSTLPRLCVLGLCKDRYGYKDGTSMAAPIVSGIAGLVLTKHPDFTAAQIKQCILAGAQKGGSEVMDQKGTRQGFRTLSTVDAVKCEGEVPLPNKVDLVFALDLTKSMSEELNQVKVNIRKIIDELLIKASPSTDFQFAVVSYEDYLGAFDSTKCGSKYSDEYGSSSKPGGDAPFRIDQPLTNDINAVYNAISALQLGSGEDDPESYGRVFWSIAQEIKLRDEALKLVVNFGDSVPHDKDLNQGIDKPPKKIFDTGIDPGPNGQIDCGGDDIDFQDHALTALSSNSIHLLHIDSSGEPDLAPYWQYWVSQTGGAFAAINPDGTVPGGLDLTKLILELLRLTPR